MGLVWGNTAAASDLAPADTASSTPPTVASTLAVMALTNGYFQAGNLPEGVPIANNDWTGGVYMAGNMAHYRASANESLLEYAVDWGDHHNWQPAGYERCHGNLGCPDNIACGQGYAEVSAIKKNATMIAAIRSGLEASMTNPCEVATNSSQAKDSDRCWWWVDALFMALPVYVFDAVCCVYTCRRLIDLSLIAGTLGSAHSPRASTPRPRGVS